MYAAVLLIHSYLRWAFLALALVVLVRCFRATKAKSEWSTGDERLHVAFVGITDLQLLLGFLLYLWLSPLPGILWANFGLGVKEPIIRFFGLEHPVMMLAAVAVIHIGRVRSKKAPSPELRHRRVWRSTLFALLVVVSSIPWPGLRHERPLARGVSTADSCLSGTCRLGESCGWRWSNGSSQSWRDASFGKVLPWCTVPSSSQS